jgi:hypothetical protein
MLLPFKDELDDLFRSDRSIWLKGFGGAALGILVALWGLFENDRPGGLNVVLDTIFVSGSAVIGAAGVVLLSLKDVVARRFDNRRHVNWLLMLYFGHGPLSFFFWIVTVLAISLPIIVVFFGFMRL